MRFFQTMKKYSYKHFRVFIHLLFWFLVLGFYTILFGSESSDYKGAFQFVIMLLPITIATTYFLNNYLIPKYILKKKYLLFLLYFVYTFIISITLGLNVVLLTFVVIADFNVGNMVPASFNIIYLIAGNYLVVLFAVTIKLINHWYKMENKNLLLEKQSVEIELKLKEAELKLLKSQIHPHFLFNTLNNLYGLTLSKSNQAPEIVLKISSLLDYTLYQSNKHQVNLVDEISFIKDYIELEQLRYSNLKLELKLPDDGKNFSVAPMIFQPFIENAFKHGVSKDMKDPWIKINMNMIENNELQFMIVNSKIYEDINDPTGYTEGIGLKNVKKRLEILYPNKHDLQITDKGNKYQVELILNLNFSVE